MEQRQKLTEDWLIKMATIKTKTVEEKPKQRATITVRTSSSLATLAEQQLQIDMQIYAAKTKNQTAPQTQSTPKSKP